MRKVEKALDPDIVRARMKEFRKDETAFYAKYGGGPSIGYDLIDEDGQSYPPAAIVQAALGWSDVKGGVKARDSAGRGLRLHGFRVIKKGARLKSAPNDLEEAIAILTKIVKTETRNATKIRIGSSALRDFAIRHKICCEVTSIADKGLLRVSHINSWSSDKQNRLNPENIILLAAHWDAAFDRGLVSFDREGVAIYSPKLSPEACALLKSSEDTTLSLTDERAAFLMKHRKKFGFQE